MQNIHNLLDNTIKTMKLDIGQEKNARRLASLWLQTKNISTHKDAKIPVALYLDNIHKPMVKYIVSRLNEQSPPNHDNLQNTSNFSRTAFDFSDPLEENRKSIGK